MPSTKEANSSIADEFLGFCEASDNDRTLSPSRKRAEAITKKSLRDEFAPDSANSYKISPLVTIHQKYYDISTKHNDIDLICSRHTIEHIPNPLQFLQSIRESVEGDPLVFFETPSLEWILENGAFYDFFYEHCNYFTKQSLEILFYRANFLVLEIKKSFNNQYFQIFAKVKNTDKAPHISEIKKELSHYKNIAIWGAGAKGVTLANELKNAICVIDINPNKQNCFIPKCGLEILSPDSAFEKHNIDLILVMNPNYENEIKLLCKNYKIPIKCVV